MSFTLPEFNLTCDIYTGPWATRVFRLSASGNLAFGKRVQQAALDSVGGGFPIGSSQPVLLLPALTDIRSGVQVPKTDLVEVPSGSGRWYLVFAVDDIGKGFPNEHRAAVLIQVSSLVSSTEFAGLNWPVPMT
jgi:hypothetical protein